MIWFRLLAGAAVLAAVSPAVAAPNPFAQPSTLPFQAPPFDKITDTDYQPAIEEGIKDSLAEIRLIADNPAAPPLTTPSSPWSARARC